MGSGGQRLLMVVMPVGIIMLMLARTNIGLYLVITATVFALCCVTYIYIDRFHRETAVKLYGGPARPVVDFFCAVTRVQPPLEHKATVPDSSPGANGEAAATSPSTHSVIRSEAEFEIAADAITSELLGHDDVVARILDDLRRAVVVRIKRPESNDVPLGVYLLAGPPGIGKRMLAHEIGAKVYPEGRTLTIDGREYGDALFGVSDLFGGGGGAGRLVAAVREQPLQTIVFRGVDSAHPEVLDRLAHIVQEGLYADPSSGAPVSFKHTMLFMTSAKARLILEPIIPDFDATCDEWQARARSILLEHGVVPRSLLESTHLVLPMSPLPAMDRAMVVARHMQRECERHRVKLSWIDPEVLAEETELVTEARGFRGIQARIKSRLRDDLNRAVEISMPQIRIVQRPSQKAASQRLGAEGKFIPETT